MPRCTMRKRSMACWIKSMCAAPSGDSAIFQMPEEIEPQATVKRLQRWLARSQLRRMSYFSRSNALRVGTEMARPQFRQSSPKSSRCEYHVNKLLKNFSVSLLQPSAASSASVNNSTISLGQNQALNQHGNLIARMPRCSIIEVDVSLFST